MEESTLYSDANNIFDEQDTLKGLPSWWNSTYFDEIYHARTAYEHLHGTTPYETSHPPLGKVIMSLGIAIFGMVPFGWRVMGALAGILMLPAMYLLGKQLTKKSSFAFAAALMLALDCQHFTQTRIATIDSYPVLFILFSWLFMLRFMQRDIVRLPVKKLLPDLALSGLFMGLGIASKWIGVYSGAGLAVAFFWDDFPPHAHGGNLCAPAQDGQEPVGRGQENPHPARPDNHEARAGDLPVVSAVLRCHPAGDLPAGVHSVLRLCAL